LVLRNLLRSQIFKLVAVLVARAFLSDVD